MKNRKGSTLIMTLLVFVVLTIFGTFILSFMVNENKMSLNHQYKIQAYYMARSGAVAVEAAIMRMDEDKLRDLDMELDKGILSVKEIKINENKVKVTINKDGNKVTIESKAEINEVDSIVIKVLEVEEILSGTNIEYAIFSRGDINLKNGTVKGDIATNNSINITGNPTLSGDAYLINGKDFTAKKWWRDKWTEEYSTKNLVQEKGYELIKFPTFPINNSDINFTQGGNSQTTITKSRDYNTFEINSNTKVYIDTTEQDIVMNIKQFNLNNGDIIILGDNKLTLYVENMVIGSGSTINYHEGPRNSEQLDILHNGESKLTVGGNVKIAGNLYISNSDLELSGSGSILGNVYHNGSNILLSGNSDITKGLIYAPNADISFTGSGKVYGAVIGNTISIQGSGMVVFDLKYIDTSIINQVDEVTLSFKSGYFK